MRHAGRLAVGLTVCIAIAVVAVFMLINQFGSGDKGVDDLGPSRPSELFLPIPSAARLVAAELGRLQPGNGLIDGRVYDFPDGFSRDEVEEWYERLDDFDAGEDFGDWAWCPAPATTEGVHYFWVDAARETVLSLEVDDESRSDSPALGDVVVSLRVRELASFPADEQPTC